MKMMLFLLAALIAVVLWQRHENGNLTRSFDRANKVATEQKNVIGMLKNQLSVSQGIARRNETAQVSLRGELIAAGAMAVRREETITRLMNENETLRRWYSAELPDVVRRLHTRAGCASAGHCLQRLPESELLPDAGNPDKDTPVYSAVPLPVPMAGNDSGMFQFPPEGALVEIAFTGGRPDKPFVRHTVPDGTSLPDIQPGEQLQQQRAEVSQRVTQAGDWVRQTDQTISETSIAGVVKADTEQRELVSRETTVKATDKITVLGTSTLLAGAIQQVCTGDYSQAVNNRVASIGGNDETDIVGSQTVTTGKDLIEKIGQIRKSVAAVQQQIIAPVVWIGSGTINVAQLMLDTLDVVKELAEQTASHTHSNTGAPTNAGAIRNTGAKADTLNGKYSPVIGK